MVAENIRFKLKKHKKLIFWLVFASLFSFLLIFSFSLWVIYKSVKSNCLSAQKEFGQDCSSALIKVIESDQHSFRQKNSAVWSLGQLADKKTLPFLMQLEDSLPDQKKCDYDNYLCLYEVKKAIKWCSSGNFTSWMYR